MKVLAMLVGSVFAASGLMFNGGGKAADEGSSAQYEVDSVHSSVVFGVTHVGASRFYGRFNKTTGQFSFDPADPSKAKFDIEVDADSIDTAFEGRDKHLKSPDFFNSKQFPTITFKSKSLEKQGDKWVLTGDLTLHGVTKAIEADFEWVGIGEMRGQKKGGFEANFKFKRSDFGMTKFQDGALGDEVKVIVALEGNQK
ncbi:MAG: YceI family protein [Phycisphaerales bacterium]|nr:YceI family protein [Phycisphaerales bacterium]MCB9855004.1 YceI family protein [Phycisphaerales bacterium]MCB9863479.1 YceI family protein [Phycisphaerales bacterium]